MIKMKRATILEDALIEIDALKAERDRLFEENGKLAAVYAERDRLRAALEEIASTGTLTIEWAKAIARRALLGEGK